MKLKNFCMVIVYLLICMIVITFVVQTHDKYKSTTTFLDIVYVQK